MQRLLLNVPPKPLYEPRENYSQYRARLCNNASAAWREAELVIELINNAASTSFPECIIHGTPDAVAARNLSEPKYLKLEQQYIQSTLGAR
jgi:hypothetical protein